MEHVGLLIKWMAVAFTLSLLIDRAEQLIPVFVLGGKYDVVATLAVSLRLPHFWTGLLVPITYLCAMWTAANLLTEFEKIKSFDSKVLTSLRSIGETLIYGGIAAIVIAPSIEAWVNLGQRSINYHWDIQPMTIGVIGAILKLVSVRAEKLQTQIDSIV